jgi:hypothetical protein
MVDPKVILDKSLLKDVAERALWTAVQAFVAVYTVGGVDEVKAAATAAVAAGISVLKGFFSTQVGDPKSASSLKK